MPRTLEMPKFPRVRVKDNNTILPWCRGKVVNYVDGKAGAWVFVKLDLFSGKSQEQAYRPDQLEIIEEDHDQPD